MTSPHDHQDPLISFVATARNDDYGGNLIGRMNVFCHVLAELALRNETPIEIVLVDYNQPTNQPPLREALRVPSNRWVRVVFVEVPSAFHLRFDRSDRIPMFEYFGKNIGIRRAQGKWIVSTNPDIIFSEELFKIFTDGTLNSAYFYRVNRNDLDTNSIDLSLPLEQLFRYCEKHTYRIFTRKGLRYASWKRWFGRLRRSPRLRNFVLAPLIPSSLNLQPREPFHVGAPGDFLLMHRDQWFRVGGYEQQQGGGAHIDSLMLYYLHCFGLKERCLGAPIWHIQHVVARHGRANMEDAHYYHLVDAMSQTGKPYRVPSPDWGFPNEPFVEIIAP